MRVAPGLKPLAAVEVAGVLQREQLALAEQQQVARVSVGAAALQEELAVVVALVE